MKKIQLMLVLSLVTMAFPISGQTAETGVTPDVLDTSASMTFPESPSASSPLSEQDRNLILNAFKGNLSNVKVLISKGADVNVRDTEKRTPTIFAADNGHTAVVEHLIGQGAEFDARDSGGRTALFYATKRSFNDTAALLIKKGADVNVQSKKKKVSPLMLAAVWNNVELAEMLIKNGANPQLTDTFGRSARLLAEKKGNSEIISLLDSLPQEPIPK